uniref:C2 n=1 Tax=Common bean curly stunt virus TaxID=2600315 RepID=A0A5B8ND48_9GEMI|nr:C2 [Common bean curly stunt virus]
MKPLGPGHYTIQKSPLSKNLSLITKAKRPKTITLPCKCKISISPDCCHGFSHRNTYHAYSSDDFRQRSTCTQSDLHQTDRFLQVPSSVPDKDSTTIQPQLKEGSQPTQVLAQSNDHWDTFDADWREIYQSVMESPITLL